MKLTPETVVYVTGGASGLGEETVRQFHAKGCKLFVVDLSQENLAKIKGQLKERIHTFQCDVSSEEQVQKSFDECLKVFGRVDVTVASAGILTVTPTLRISKQGEVTGLNTAAYRKTIEVNVYGSIYVAKFGAMAIAKNNVVNNERGVMIFVSSVAAEEGQKGQVAYGSSKGAINGFLLPMARDLGRFGIRVLAIAPGIFSTPMATGMPEKVGQRLIQDIPLGRAGTPDEFAHFAISLAENSYMSGSAFRLDGGIKLSYT